MDDFYVDFFVPEAWSALSDRQLRFVFSLLANGFAADEIRTLCLLRWNSTEVVGRLDSGAYLLRKGKRIFELSPLLLAEALEGLAWLGSLPDFPVRPDCLAGRHALPADFSGVPFQSYIICDNIYQGYLQTRRDELLDMLGATLYGKSATFRPFERICFFYWFAALKAFFARKFPDFFQPLNSDSDANMLGSPSLSVEEAMNAQIRALTKGDVTKEAEVLALDTHRALTELDAQAREYRQLNSKLNKK